MSRQSPGHTLAQEHADLLREVEERRERVLAALNQGRWPHAEMAGLVGYLRYELIDQAVQEERLLYPLTSAGFGDERIRRLVGEHVRLRDTADALAAMAAVEGPQRDPERLTATLTELREVLERHLRTEREVLSTSTESGIGDLRRPFRSHDWFPLTEGSTIDVDRLPKEVAVSAVLDRLLRMRPGERVVLHSAERLDPVQEHLSRRDVSAEYRWTYLDEAPGDRRAAVTRRTSSE